MRSSSILLIVLFLSKGILFSQDFEINLLERFNDEKYDHFYKYLVDNLDFPEDGFHNQGVLLPGMVLDSGGEIKELFCLNSLHPSIDNHVLDLFELTAGSWNSTNDSLQSIIFIVPIVFTLGKLEYKVHSENFKIPVIGEITIIASGYGVPVRYIKTSKLLKQYEKLFSLGNILEANQIMIDLLKREPLNIEYYSKYIKTNQLIGNQEIVDQSKIFIKSYFKEYPAWINDL